MLAFWIPTLTMAIPATVAPVVAFVRGVFRRRPRANTSAMQRLIDLNPTLNAAGVRWTVAARRAQISVITRVAVGVALIIATDRPVTARS